MTPPDPTPLKQDDARVCGRCEGRGFGGPRLTRCRICNGTGREPSRAARRCPTCGSDDWYFDRLGCVPGGEVVHDERTPEKRCPDPFHDPAQPPTPQQVEQRAPVCPTCNGTKRDGLHTCFDCRTPEEMAGEPAPPEQVREGTEQEWRAVTDNGYVRGGGPSADYNLTKRASVRHGQARLETRLVGPWKPAQPEPTPEVEGGRCDHEWVDAVCRWCGVAQPPQVDEAERVEACCPDFAGTGQHRGGCSRYQSLTPTGSGEQPERVGKAREEER